MTYLATQILILLIFMFALSGCSEGDRMYEVKITYTTGQKDILTIISPHHPKVEKNGCLYDYSERTYICGVRRIAVREISLQ